MISDLEEIRQDSNIGRSPAPDFTPEIWNDVGRSVLVSLLDYDGINPVSRLVSSSSDCLSDKVDQIRGKIK